MDYFSEAERRNWLTVQGLAQAALAPVIAALAGFAAAVGWQHAFWVYAFALPVAIGVMMFCFEPHSKTASNVRPATDQPFPWRAASVMGGISLLSAIFFFVFLVHAGLATQSSEHRLPGGNRQPNWHHDAGSATWRRRVLHRRA